MIIVSIVLIDCMMCSYAGDLVLPVRLMYVFRQDKGTCGTASIIFERSADFEEKRIILCNAESSVS